MTPSPSHPKRVLVTGAFEDVRSRHFRFLEEAARFGEVTVAVWPDAAMQRLTGKPPTFPLAERLYLLNAIRYVHRAMPLEGAADADAPPALQGFQADVWLDEPCPANPARLAAARQHGLEYRVLPAELLQGFAQPPPQPAAPGRKKVMVTGCYDWFHSGHVRFFEEVSAYGDLYVIVGHDANIRLLKGPGHPLLPQEERRYLAGSIRYVTQALISSGDGWVDAEPEIQRLKPDIYAVNEDGDRGGKREYCAQRGIQYLVLKRLPAPGLPGRTSTDLRGF
ncbi:MAG TPA: adenylyltransferase/cytidyltransferase family protein [Dongiaceae bacterium]|nr:adenylyltransferase/cytidyltransferase family protein [Dongiaceae bacterium]